MREICLILILVCLSPIASFAANDSSLVKPQQGQKLTPEESAQLEEAIKLSGRVVELYKDKKFDEALPLAKRAIDIRKRILGEQNGLTASAKINLAELYMARREYKSA